MLDLIGVVRVTLQANTANADGVVPMSWKASQCHDANGATGQQL